LRVETSQSQEGNFDLNLNYSTNPEKKREKKEPNTLQFRFWQKRENCYTFGSRNLIKFQRQQLVHHIQQTPNTSSNRNICATLQVQDIKNLPNYMKANLDSTQ
jgi:hypothetical protein